MGGKERKGRERDREVDEGEERGGKDRDGRGRISPPNVESWIRKCRFTWTTERSLIQRWGVVDR